MLAGDRRALEGLPLKLLIMSLLISITAPAVLGSMEGYDRSVARSEVASQAARLAQLIEEVRSDGEGNRREITVTLPEAASKHDLSVELGGNEGNASALTVRCLENGNVFSSIVLDDPPARTVTLSGSPLRLEAGETTLMLECVRNDGRIIVLVEVRA